MFTHQCPECHQQFSARERNRTYCSRSCQNTYQAKGSVKVGIYNPPTCPCGEKIAATPANPYIHAKKYCSPECRSQYGKRRQRDPEKWTTKTCRNCEKEFQLRKCSQSYGYYCSNKCAYRHTKTKQHIVFRDNDILLDSSWEALFFGLFSFMKWPVERFPRDRAVQWENNEGTVGGWYAPDFLVGDIAVEIKGLEDSDDPEKWQAFRAQGNKLAVIDRDRMKRLLSRWNHADEELVGYADIL